MKLVQDEGLSQGYAWMKVTGLFLDYDGTISPLNVPREESRVPHETQKILYQIKQLIPVGIITTKDLPFILPRTGFASAWGAIAGLEIKFGDRIIKAAGVQEVLPYISLALENARRWSAHYLFFEEKRDTTGQTIAFCVDWRHFQKEAEAESQVMKVMAYCESLPLTIIKYEGQPFFDVYPCPVDKGKALEELKRLFDLRGGVMYLGDSKVDNPAFRVADIAIGVRHGESAADLDCQYYLRFEDVASFLRRLVANNLVFDESFPQITITNKEGKGVGR